MKLLISSNSCLLAILVGFSATAWRTSAENTEETSSLEFDPPVAFTQYEGGCEDDANAVFSGMIASIEVMEWSQFCVEDINDIGSLYTKLEIDCTYDAIIENYSNCTDNTCSDCVPELFFESPWSSVYPDLPADYCFNSTYKIGGEERYIQYKFDKTDNYDDAKSYHEMVNANSCINSWQPFLEDLQDDDPMPDDAIQCPDAPGYCNCERDCVEFPFFCSCEEAQSCCEGAEEIYDKDDNDSPDSFIMCSGEQDVCDCSNDCFFNKQQCACEEAQACCSTKVNCPDSPPSEHCDCNSDCTENPQWCTCEEGQSCCADDEECLTILELICDASDEHTILCDLFSKWALTTGNNEEDVNWTLFAPNDAAFAEIEDELATLTEDEIERIVLFHSIGGEADVPENSKLYDDLECTEQYEMLSGDISRTKCIKNEEKGGIWEKYQKGGGNRKNDNLPKIIENDIKACNGVLHVLDAVMLPNYIDKFE